MSTPIWSFFGKVMPQSISTMRPPLSTTYMFLPISPAPPRGITRTDSLTGALPGSGRRRPRQEALPFEDGAEDVPLDRGGLHQRQAQAPGRDQPGHLERRLDQ